MLNQPGDALCYVSSGLRPPPLPSQSASPDWFDSTLGGQAGEIHKLPYSARYCSNIFDRHLDQRRRRRLCPTYRSICRTCCICQCL